MNSMIILILFNLITLNAFDSTGLSSVGIDLGCDMIKIGIAQPYLRISITTDEFNNRMIPASVYINNDKILFGNSAMKMLSSDPTKVYLHLPCLIGKGISDPRVQDYIDQFPYYNLQEDFKSKSLYYINERNNTYFVDELVALLLDYCIRMANKGIENIYRNLHPIKIVNSTQAVVITIPKSYRQKERRVLLRICKMANINVLHLFECNQAAYLSMASLYLKRGLLYGTYGILDIGAEHIQMSLANIQKTELKVRSQSFETSKIEIVSSSFQSNYGIHHVIKKMQEHFIGEITNISSSTEFLDLKHLEFFSRLYLGCRDILHRLVSSENVNITIPRLFRNQNITLSMTKYKFREIIGPTLTAIKEVIKETLLNARNFWIIPKGIAVIGGGKFLPYVDNEIQQYLRRIPYLKVLDSFYGVAWGATYRATNIAPGIFYFPIIVSENTIKSVKIWITMGGIIEKMNVIFQPEEDGYTSSTLFRNVSSDFNFTTLLLPTAIKVFPNTTPNTIDSIFVHRVFVSNLKKTLMGINICKKEYIKTKSCHSFKGVKILYEIDIHSILKLKSVDAIFVKRSLCKNDKKIEESSKHSHRRLVVNETILELINIKLEYHIYQRDDYVNEEQLTRKIQRVNEAKLRSKEHFAKEAVKNELEYYVNDMKKKFNEEDYIICTTNMERRLIWSFLDDTTRWIKEVDHSSISKKEYFYKFDHLISLTSKVDTRVHEIRNRPILINKLSLLLETTHHFIMSMFKTSGSGTIGKGIFTTNETSDLRALNKETKKWLLNLTEIFKNLNSFDDPPILCEKIIEKIVSLENHHDQLLKVMEKRLDPTKEERRSMDQILIEGESNKEICNNEESGKCFPAGGAEEIDSNISPTEGDKKTD